MSTRHREQEYRCDNDCVYSGCQGHKLVGTLQDTSDIVIIDDENGERIFSGDISKTKALINILGSLDYNDQSYFDRILPPK